jgi:hypothetical protein
MHKTRTPAKCRLVTGATRLSGNKEETRELNQ